MSLGSWGVVFAPLWVLWGSPISVGEVLASALGLGMVACNMVVNPMAWPLAIASSALYALLFLDSRLYGEASLQLLFIAMALWGWAQWRRGRGLAGNAPLRVHSLGRRGRLWVLGLTLAAWPLLGLLLSRVTDSDVPYLDALPTVGSITGTLLLGRKLIENWPVWIAVNIVSIGLFAVKGLWLTVALYAVFAVLAAVGWRAWAAIMAAQPAAASTPRR